ncbi:MAG TPA: LysR family transcriptional regulator [Kofleriaceae bacterium]|jgi:DNA-binding transcriptional LysR family regulator
MDLNEIAVFARVVQAGSFIAASKALGMPKSTVSRKVADLEERLDTRLLQRTTRKLSLTDAGRLLFDHCARIVSEVENAERAVTSLHDTPRGVLRVTAGTNATFLGPLIRDYLKRYPEVRLQLLCTARNVDLIEERFDLGIRAGRLADSSLIAKSLGTVTWLLVATPAYLKRRGRPRAPADLAEHDCLSFGAGSDRATLHLRRGDEPAEVALTPRLAVSDIEILHQVTVGGMGIALLPAYQCIADLRTHRLERVLRDWDAPTAPIHIVYPSTRHVSPAVKSFIDHLQQHMMPPPWELGPMP